MAASSTRLTLGSILGTVNTTANVITSAVDVLGAGISMVTRYANDAATEQEKRSIINMGKLDEHLIREAAQSESLADLDIANFRAKSQKHDELYISNYEKFSNLLRPKSA